VSGVLAGCAPVEMVGSSAEAPCWQKYPSNEKEVRMDNFP